mmetsp:Transcript_27827/g.96265  ORF Transcript_27827/g.96265 Transcript_27827/m.96265 type:complete len:206 (-) Transcript_27827:92-709(-)
MSVPTRTIATERAAAAPPVPHRGDKYPRHIAVDFKQLRLSTLKRYIRNHEMAIRADSTATDYAVACAVHFESALPVEEEDTISRFMNYVKRSPGGSVGRLSAGGKRSRSAEDRSSKRKKRASRKAQEAEEDAGVEVEAEDDEQRLYCFCRRVSYGDMIACDNTRCRYEWFHLPCVGLETGKRPRGKWYCPECARGRDSSDDDRRK